MWVDFDGSYALVNSALGRQKDRNICPVVLKSYSLSLARFSLTNEIDPARDGSQRESSLWDRLPLSIMAERRFLPR